METLEKRKGIEDNCLVCKKPVLSRTRRSKKYCSYLCRSAAWRHENRQLFSSFGLPTATVGAISELVAGVDLMKRGYEVHRALSPAAQSDVIAIKDGTVYRFEIRTGQYTKSKTVSYPKNNVRAENMAVVTNLDNQVHYFPEVFIPAFIELR